MININRIEEQKMQAIDRAVNIIKMAILKSQYRAAKQVNAVQLSLYFGVGKYISEHSGKGFWGTGALKTISERLHRELPGLRGYSEQNMRNMRLFYEQWAKQISSPSASKMNGEGELGAKCSPSASELDKAVEIDDSILLRPINSPVTSIEQLQEFLSVSFTHHAEILHKTNTIDERLFYIHQAYIHQWNKYELRDILKTDLYHHQPKMANNFISTIDNPQTALRAIEMFKDEYLLDYINVEELGARDSADVDEKVVEQKIIQNVKNFIMTFGTDFTFVGNQYHLEKDGHDMFPDLLFYNRELAALVVVELKRGEFKPAYLGQLSGYLRVLDTEVKKPFENPSIGIILCKCADKSYVEFLIQGYNNPMGVATYKSQEDIKRLLPPEEELLRILNEGIIE